MVCSVQCVVGVACSSATIHTRASVQSEARDAGFRVSAFAQGEEVRDSGLGDWGIAYRAVARLAPPIESILGFEVKDSG